MIHDDYGTNRKESGIVVGKYIAPVYAREYAVDNRATTTKVAACHPAIDWHYKAVSADRGLGRNRAQKKVVEMFTLLHPADLDVAP